jgi:mannosyltransferase OCH1-like enzyme
MFFDDAQVEDFIDSEFLQYRSLFDSASVRIQRYDFFRYLAVYRLGGFSFNTDVILASSFQSLLDFGCSRLNN